MNAVSQSREMLVFGTIPDQLDWYIYYRVRAERAELLHKCVTEMQQRLQQEHGISSALKRRPQLRDGLHTWMEVYTSAPRDFDMILAAEVEKAALAELIDGERHIEHFWDISSCA